MGKDIKVRNACNLPKHDRSARCTTALASPPVSEAIVLDTISAFGSARLDPDSSFASKLQTENAVLAFADDVTAANSATSGVEVVHPLLRVYRDRG